VIDQIENQLAQALAQLQADGLVPDSVQPRIIVTRTKDSSHGDFASNLAMMLAKPSGKAPREIAQALIGALPKSDGIRDVVIAGPGFINFFQADDALSAVITKVLDQQENFGQSNVGAGQKVQVEFVSANPTGPLHVGHGRGAALGASIANLLNATGYDVQREYYVNDAGRQMDILAASVWLRYLALQGEKFEFPSNGYKGEYILDISQSLIAAHGDAFKHEAKTVFDGVVADEPQGGDKEKHIDAIIERAKTLLGLENYRVVFDAALVSILDDIRQDLGEFGVEFDEWFSERSLSNDVNRVVEKLEKGGHLYEKEGVRWFRSTDFGDDKDRPVVRANGQTTYFASDIAYIDNKLQRGFDQVLYIFGADHHGYTARLFAACEALGHSKEKLEFLLIQFAILFRGGERVQMSTRSGSFVTIRELREEVGKDAARYFYVMRKYSQHLDFDLDLAKSQSNENPVYYVQYAYARICSVFRQLEQRNLTFDRAVGLASLARLTESAETELMTLLAVYPELIQRAVCLLVAVRQVLNNGLALIDVSTPEVM